MDHRPGLVSWPVGKYRPDRCTICDGPLEVIWAPDGRSYTIRHAADHG